VSDGGPRIEIEHGVAVVRQGHGDTDWEAWADTTGLVVSAWMDGGYHEESALIPWDVIERMRQHGGEGYRTHTARDIVSAAGTEWRPPGGCTSCPGGQHNRDGQAPIGPPRDEVDDKGAHWHLHDVQIPVPSERVEWPVPPQ